MRNEAKKLKHLGKFPLDVQAHLGGMSARTLRWLRHRARGEDAGQLRQHPPAIRYALLAVFAHTRRMEITDHVIKTFLELGHRIEKRTDRALAQELFVDIRQVYGKRRLLYQIARLAVAQPEGTIRDVLYSAVGEDVLHRLVEEAEHQDPEYDHKRAEKMKQRYDRHYRQMMEPLLGAIQFRSHNPAQQPLLDGLALVGRYLTTSHTYYPEEEPIPESLLTGHWQELARAEGPRVSKKYFELCVLEKIEDALKCKEVWAEGAYRYRDPDQDLPQDWGQPARREAYYQQYALPRQPDTLIETLQAEMQQQLTHFNRFLDRRRDVYIHRPGGGKEGVFHVPRLTKQPERPRIQAVKAEVLQRWGFIDLLDILLEADRQVHFARFFHTSGQRQILDPDAMRRRLLLCLFSLGTNMGLKRIHASANAGCSYDDLRYFRSRFINVEAVREAIAALTNRILEVRNPAIWGQGTACASDGKQLGAWEQNLMTEWHPHYHSRGVMAYWHVDTNATCVYSQLKTCSSSEVAALLEGLVRHDTEMRVESNFVDSHGQSEVAFAFCRLLGIDLLPRLKRIKHERLYLPGRGMTRQFPNLAGVFARPIRWQLIRDRYDDIARHVVALAEGTGSAEAILRRFHKSNRTHPTYRAMIELGKAQKTIFLCRCLTQPGLRREIHGGLNVVESWNACNEFICFCHKGELQTNNPELQELTILCLHLLQNALILVNTLVVEQVLRDGAVAAQLEPADMQAITPLFSTHVNPCGEYDLDLHKPSILAAAA